MNTAQIVYTNLTFICFYYMASSIVTHVPCHTHFIAFPFSQMLAPGAQSFGGPGLGPQTRLHRCLRSLPRRASGTDDLDDQYGCCCWNGSINI